LALDGMTPREISGQDLRMVVGRTLGFQHLQSTAFELRRAGSAYRFTGRGAGHGVGLCVIGSMKLASAGQSEATILRRYFPGTRIGSSAPRLTATPPERPSIAAPPRETIAAPPVLPTPAPAPAPAAPSAARRSEQPEGGRAESLSTSDVTVVVPNADQAERATLSVLVAAQRDQIAQALGVDRARVVVRVHESTDAYEKASGQPWFTLGAVVHGELNLTPLWLLRERGMLEQTLRRQLTRLMADPLLKNRPAWVKEGAAVYFADPVRHAAPRGLVQPT